MLLLQTKWAHKKEFLLNTQEETCNAAKDQSEPGSAKGGAEQTQEATELKQEEHSISEDSEEGYIEVTTSRRERVNTPKIHSAQQKKKSNIQTPTNEVHSPRKSNTPTQPASIPLPRHKSPRPSL